MLHCFRHGDIIYVSYAEQAQPIDNHKDTDSSPPMLRDHVKQDPVDDFLEKQRGLIHRKKDPKL